MECTREHLLFQIITEIFFSMPQHTVLANYKTDLGKRFLIWQITWLIISVSLTVNICFRPTSIFCSQSCGVFSQDPNLAIADRDGK